MKLLRKFLQICFQIHNNYIVSVYYANIRLGRAYTEKGYNLKLLIKCYLIANSRL